MPEGIITSYDPSDFTPVESWSMTAALRWRHDPDDSTKPPILEQMWRGSMGGEAWHPIESVTTKE